jgi:diguanylate cyclase (GGDEF)-like protein
MNERLLADRVDPVDQVDQVDQVDPVESVDRIDLVAAERTATEVRRLLADLPERHDPARARSWLGAVERVLAQAGDHDRARLLQARASVRADEDPHGRFQPDDEVVRDAAAAAELFERLGEPLTAATNFAAAATAAAQAGRITLALETAVRALVALGDVPAGGRPNERDAALEAHLATRLGALCWQFFDYPRALRFYELALAAADGAGQEERWSAAMIAIGDALLAHIGQLSPHHAQRAALLDRAEQLARRLTADDVAEVVRAVHGPRLLADVLCERGRLDEAWQLLRGISRLLPDELAGRVHLTAGRCLLLRGRAVEAVVELDVALGLLSAQPHLAERILGLRLRSSARQAAGDVPGALADARTLADLLWTSHQRQVGGFMDQLWSRAGAEGERRDLEAQARDLLRSAEQDPLTGLANRRAVQRCCAQLRPGGQVCLVLIDVDHFKEVNDRYGHSVGDAVLREMATLLTRSVRGMDVVARWGGEEFLIALPGGSGRLGADAADRVCVRVRAHSWSRLAPQLRLTISAGVASGPADELDAVLRRADGALYGAKQSGRDRVVSG